MKMHRPLKILVVTQYFWPENMRINDLVEGLMDRGHQITVLTGIPNYPEGRIFPDYKNTPEKFSDYKGAAVVRVPMFARGKRNITLGLNYLSFFISATIAGSIKLRKQHFDVVFVYAVSPIMVAIPAIFIGKIKKAPVLVWILDLWPDSLHAVGVIKNRMILSLVGRCVSWIYQRVDYLLVQSRAFVENVRHYCQKPAHDDRIVYFPSWAENIFSSTASGVPTKHDSVFTIVFAGNVGEAQDFPSILTAVEQLRNTNTPVRWVIAGDGRAGSWLRHALDNVRLLGKRPLDEMPALFATADALFVSLKTNDVFARTIPGKIQTYLASGKPIIAMLDGEGASVITEAQAGRACASGDVSGLVSIVQEMAAMPKAQREAMGQAGKNYYREHFSREKLLGELECLFHQAVTRKQMAA